MMKVAVFGGNWWHRSTHCQTSLGAASYKVTVVARTLSKVILEHPNLNVVQGDVMVEQTLGSALAGQDTVRLVLGVGNNNREPTTLYSNGTRNVLQAMKAQNIRRFIGVSASGFINDPNDGFLVKYAFKPLLQQMFKNPYDNLNRMEAEVRSSELDWTLVWPTRLMDGDHTGVYRILMDMLVSGGSSISRADVADFMVKHVGDAEVIGRAVGIAY